MAVDKITFADKVSMIESTLPVINRIRDVDVNEIKDVVNNNANELEAAQENISMGGIKLYKLAETGDLSTGTITLADNVNNYVALIIITGYVTDGYIDSHIIVPWIGQLDASGNFSGWRVGSDNKEISFQRGTGRVAGYLTSNTTINIVTNTTGYNIRGVYGIKAV